MSRKDNKRIFLSYARRDGEEFARSLRQRLENEGLSLWQDRTDMEGGRDWWNQIDEALNHVEYMVVVMTARAARSEVVSKEWRLARQRGVGVIPVAGPGELDFQVLPRWMRETHFVDVMVDEQWKRLIRQLESPCQVVRVPFMAPGLPADFVERPREYGALAAALLNREAPVAITAALKGAGGYGKTTLAMRLCHDDRVQEEFHDGVLWVTLGEKPGDVTSKVIDLIEILSGERPGFADADTAAARLAELLADHDLLMVIDDVWNASDARPFLRGGTRCARLITTRNSEALPDTCVRTDLDAMKSHEAIQLLGWKLPESPRYGRLAARLGEWPLLLKMVNGTLRKRLGAGERFDAALEYVERVLEKRGLTGFDERNVGERNRAAALTLGVSLDQLDPQERARLKELAVFPEDAAVPLGIVERLWRATANLDELDSEDLCRRLFDLSLLLGLDLAAREIRMHDVVRTFLREQGAQELAAWNARLLDSYGGVAWWQVDRGETYLWRQLPYHLSEAKRFQQLGELLFDYRWLEAKLRVAGLNALLDDYEMASGKTPAMEAVAHALRLSAHVLAEDTGQLPGQIAGRLADHGELPEVSRLCESTDRWAARPWIRPRFPDLERPGGALLRTYSGHPDKVIGLVVSGDGCRAVAACWDSLTVWDLESEQWVAAFDTDGDISALAMSGDGCTAITGHWDGAIRAWDLQTGQRIGVIGTHMGAVNALALMADSTLVSGSDDETIAIWKIQPGEPVSVLRGHRGGVSAVACGGRRIVAASKDNILRVWDEAGKQPARRLEGHRSVSALAVSHDGRLAVSGSWNGTLAVWDLDRGEVLRHLDSFSERTTFEKISSLIITRDGKRFVSASDDKALKLWDLEQGRELRSFAGHTDRVSALALLASGGGVLSASWDRTVKVWDLESAPVNRVVTGHLGSVRALAVTRDGKRAFSAGRDATLRLWDVEKGIERCRFDSAGNVHSVAVTGDGRRAMSVSDNGDLDLFDLDAGAALSGAVSFSSNTDVNKIVVGESGFQVIHTSASGATSWDPETGKRCRDFERGFDPVTVTTDGRHAISLKPSNLIQRLDVSTGEVIATRTNQDYWVHDVAVSPAGLRALTSGLDTLRVVDVESGEVLHTWERNDAGCVVALSANGGLVLRAPSRFDEAGELWDLATGAESKVDDLSGLSSVAVSADGRTMLSGSESGWVALWHMQPGRSRQRNLGRHPKAASSIAVSADGRRGISGSRDGTVKIWNLQTGTEIESSSGFAAVRGVAITADGSRVAVLDGSLTIWDAGIDDGFHRSFPNHAAESVLCLTPDGKAVITAASQGHVPALWNAETGKAIGHLPREFPWESSVTVTPDASLAICSGAHWTVRLWDIPAGVELTSLGWDVSEASVTPDARRVALVSRGGSLSLWDPEKRRQEAVFTADAPFVKCAIAADGRTIVAGDLMGRIHFLTVME